VNKQTNVTTFFSFFLPAMLLAVLMKENEFFLTFVFSRIPNVDTIFSFVLVIVHNPLSCFKLSGSLICFPHSFLTYTSHSNSKKRICCMDHAITKKKGNAPKTV
jgi:hypothetical protein